MPRLVLVTGGSGGLGSAVAARFVAAGDDVLITGRDAGRLARAAEATGARQVRCDIARPDDVADLVAGLGRPVDVVVGMAGGNTDFDRAAADPAATTADDAAPAPLARRLADTADAWRANLDANLIGTMLTVEATLPEMPEGGSIITVGSIGAEYAGSSYGVAKAAVQAWTAGLSARVGPRGITANCIAPGFVDGTDYFRGRLSDERRERLVAATHDKRAGAPADVAGLAWFLASPGARHVTGQTLHVNGGAHTTR
ncbi:SDR family NAD(P)-dependent oxidoreductase [Myceligenerans pegani]|uniref:SDR family oxidoreductase n=1 Tax=Myceligenerans pegani TaxID=2776917 RepID=A0ABR9MZP9_9MICO|nr:SDR family oxidoreductase [Myceligenerans sp. TRM 65318]MBE1876868.1 SDR family oxidoreductase [Myceligenerans sp. TRM 65318]MBE3019139.1 SDR family oxidoreductase [Myceligenerans sp. TRM 65318]